MKRDNTRMVLTVDKGVSMVVVDREDYTAESEELLHQPNYKILQTDPTNKYKNKLISLLKSIKAEGGMDDNTYRRLYPTGVVSPKYYGLPKVHKPGMPLRPIISSIGSVTHSTAKELARILKPLVGKSSHHVKNNMGFIQSIEDIQLKPEEYMMSFDAEALVYLCANRTSNSNYQEALGRRQKPAPKNNHDNETDLLSSRILSHNHLLHLPGEDVWTS